MLNSYIDGYYRNQSSPRLNIRIDPMIIGGTFPPTVAPLIIPESSAIPGIPPMM